MAKPRKPRPLCPQCGVREAATPSRGPYCGRTCAGLARQQRVTVACAYCGKEEIRRPSELGASDDHFCTHSHYVAWKRAQVREFTCGYCGERRQLAAWAKTQTFCSNRCSGLAKRTRVSRVCPMCSTEFDAEPNEVAGGRGKYCSKSCRYEGRRQNCAAEKLCARDGCGQVICGNRSTVRKRRYCSRRCRWGADGGRSEWITCQREECRKRKLVPRSLLNCGWGKFCSRACYLQSRREARPWVKCDRRGCLKRFQVSPSAAGRRRFCSWRCQVLSRRPGTFRCPVCRKVEQRKPGRRPKFCSGACRNRGRHRARSPLVVARNQFILELAANKMKSPRISEKLKANSDGWGLSPPSIRKVISRGR